MTECLFCRIVNREIPSEVVFEDSEVLAFNDIRPKAPIHVLIIPKRHLDSLSAAQESDQALLGTLNLRIGQIARQLGVDQRFRVQVNNGRAAGQEVDHLHYHLLAERQG